MSIFAGVFALVPQLDETLFERRMANRYGVGKCSDVDS